MSSPLATVGIISTGQMGLGVAKLLQAHNYRVLTNVSNRSPATQTRAKSAALGLVDTDIELVAQSDYIFSIVPPRDAVTTAGRVIEALNSSSTPRASASSPLYYLDLNAIAPSTATTIETAFKELSPSVRLIDGGIIGGPPSPSPESTTWKRPGIPLSGPHPLEEAPKSGAHLAETLGSEHIGPKIGSASGLKCCFASLSKGFIALGLQSFSTASALGVLPSLEKYLGLFNPSASQRVANGFVGSPPKAYRWVEEMRQIGLCFEEDGGWDGQAQANIFREVANVYDTLAKVVEQRGGTEGMESAEGSIGALKEGLKGKQRERRQSVEELEQSDDR